MELKLEHLAPYLPYKLQLLQIRRNDDPTRNNIKRVVEWKLGDIIQPFVTKRWMVKSIKPILRPLSDLRKLGDENIPINEHTINMLIGTDDDYGKAMLSEYKGKLRIEIESEDYSNYEFIDYSIFQIIQNELLKGHFDVFGLIEKNLAVDINTLK